MEEKKSDSKSVSEVILWWKSAEREFKNSGVAILWVISCTENSPRSLSHCPHLSGHPSIQPLCSPQGCSLLVRWLNPLTPHRRHTPQINWTKGELEKSLRPCHDIKNNRGPLNSSSPVSLEEQSTARIQLWHFTGELWLTTSRVRWVIFGPVEGRGDERRGEEKRGNTTDQLSLCLAKQTWCGHDKSKPSHSIYAESTGSDFPTGALSLPHPLVCGDESFF